MTPVLQVALGGALGALLRYLLASALARDGFPVAILACNLLGSLAMGVAFVLLDRAGLGGWQPFLMTGLLGGFTTFSAFSLETVALIERGAAGQAVLYVLLSVGLSVVALAAGLWMARTAT
jgi:CrcB protein